MKVGEKSKDETSANGKFEPPERGSKKSKGKGKDKKDSKTEDGSPQEKKNSKGKGKNRASKEKSEAGEKSEGGAVGCKKPPWGPARLKQSTTKTQW